MQANYDPETAATVWNSPAYHTTAIKWTSPLSSSLFLEAGWSNNTEYYTNEYQEGIEQPRGSAAWFAKAAKNEQDLGGYTQAGPTNTTESPVAFYWNVAATYVKGVHTIKVGANNRQGTFKHTRQANADLIQQYRSSRTGVRWSVPDSVLIRNSPLAYAERLNRDLGVYIQDSIRLNRLTANVGLRWETLNAKVLAGKSPAGRFVPERTFDEILDVPDWSDFAPRMALVYDLMGNGRTAIKYSLNRYNLSRTTGIAAAYNPLVSVTATLPWRDVNGDDIAQGERGCTGYPRVGCEISFTGLSSNFGVRWRIPGGGQMSGGMSFERERQKACTSPDDPNFGGNGQGLCDEFLLDIPYKPQYKLSGTKDIGWGINLAVSFQNNSSPNSSRVMTVTRGATRYPASCPAPCPAGQVIMPSTVFAQPSMTYNLESVRATQVERIVQLDFKVSRTFRVSRFTILPTFEVFNLNNSDAIISYITTNVLSAAFLRPNSIMQGRMYGLGVVARW